MHSKKNIKLGHAVALAAASATISSQSLVFADAQLVTGKRIVLPPLGVQQNVGSLPMNLMLTSNGRFAISTDMGFRESLWSIDAKSGIGVSHLDFPKGTGNNNGLYFGLALAPTADGTSVLYAAQGGNDSIAVVKVASDGNLSQTSTIATKKNDFPSGLALDRRGFLYVANNDPAAYNKPSSFAVYDTSTGLEVARLAFTASFVGTPNFPLGVAALSSGTKVYVSSQRDSSVYVINTSEAAAPAIVSQIPTGQHPTALVLNRSQTRLYVANGNSDTVSVIDTATDTVVDTILVRPDAARGLAGVSPNGLGLSPDEKTLYVTLGDMNAVAVIDLGTASLKGYIPIGWHPTSVAATLNKKLIVANAKGIKPRNPNPTHISDPDGAYILNIIEGTVSTMNVPSSFALASETQQVLAANSIAETTSGPNPALDAIGLRSGKIKHVFYIVKENRTYDQILGDISKGNGDPSLAQYGARITPNQHALANRFVLLDNFFDCGEASGDGWPWSTGSFANEYVIKNLPYNYSGRGRNYDFEGQNNNYPVGGFPAKDPDGRPYSAVYPGGLPSIPDVGEAPAKHIWDLAREAGLSYRNYGFFYTFGDVTTIPDNYPAATGVQPAGHNLTGISDPDFRRFDVAYADSDAPALVAASTGNAAALFPVKTYGIHAAPSRFSEWNAEFKQLLAADPTGNSIPAFETVRFMNDHTTGLSAGKHTARSEVADNDFAVGEFVDAISKSPIWQNSAIFVIEDDAQDGSDHVDAHRSTCYVVSPYIKQSSVDHTFYNTDSVLRSIEDLLGLRHMSQYDAIASPILDFDTSPSNAGEFNAVPEDPAIILEHNALAASLPKGSEIKKLTLQAAKLDFVHPDSAPASLVNRMNWVSEHGTSKAMPAPRYSASLQSAKAKVASKSDASKKDID